MEPSLKSNLSKQESSLTHPHKIFTEKQGYFLFCKLLLIMKVPHIYVVDLQGQSGGS